MALKQIYDYFEDKSTKAYQKIGVLGAISGILIVLVALYDKGWMREDLVNLLIATFQFEPLTRPVFPYVVAIFLYILAIIVTSAVKNTKAVGIVLIVISVMTMILVREINALVASASLLTAGIIASRYNRRKQLEKARNELEGFWQRLDKKYNIIEKADKAHSIQEWNDISHELYELLEKYEGVLSPDVLHNLRGFTHTIDTRLDRIFPKEIVERYEDLMSEVQHAIAKTTPWQPPPGVPDPSAATVISASAPLSTATVVTVATVAAAGIGGIAYGSLNGYVPALPDLDIIATTSADPEDIYRYIADGSQQGLVEMSRESCFGSIDQVEQTFMPSQVQTLESAQNSSTTTITIQLNAAVTALDNIFQGVTTVTEPADVDVIEVTRNYMDIDENSFSIEPSNIERSQEGQRIIKWENVGQYVGNRDNKLSANETFSVSFSAGVLSNTGNASQRVPVSVEEESVVKYADPDENVHAVMIPQTYVNINTRTCSEPSPNGTEVFRLVDHKFIVPGSNDGTRGVYEEHSSNVFNPDEEINLYAEYAGMTQKPIDDGAAKTRYLTNTTGKFITTDKEGNVINATDIELNPFDTRTLDTRIVNHSSFYIFRNYIANESRDPGEYVISYTITDNLSGEKIEGAKDFIIAGIEQPLTVGIISNGTEGVAPATFEFEANITGGTEPYTYLWNFGDDSEGSDEQTVLHTFEKEDIYNVALTITDSEDQTAFVSLEIPVKESASGGGREDVIPEDTIPPVIFVPDDITEEATSPDGATVFFEVSAEDDVDGAVDVSCNYNSGDTFPIGETVVKCNAEDVAHNAAEEESFAITVEEPPVEEPPSNET